MSNTEIYVNRCDLQFRNVLKVAFNESTEDSITEEQLRRVVEPVLRMIDEGRFDRNRFRRLKKHFKPFFSIAVLTVLTLSVLLLLFKI